MAQIVSPSTQTISPPSLSAPRPNAWRRLWKRLPALTVAVALFGLWHFQTRDSASLAFVIATPEAVWRTFWQLLGNGTLLNHLGTTVLEVTLGLLMGVPSAVLLGYVIARNRFAERTFGPYVIGFQAVPLIAIAPILITRLGGPGIASVSVVAALIVFFPMLMATLVGIRSVPSELHELFRALNASPWQTLYRLELPSAAPSLFGGLRVSVTLAVVGTVVGEGYGATAGLGFMIFSSRFMYNPAGVMVGVFTLTALALLLYEIVAQLERRALRWRGPQT
ncbi:MAG: ABC transporter permease [Aggregatilineales bacterium]